ncbi:MULTISPECIES: alpha/beta hydrolase [unclassified Brevundimonas]|uniref:alpha/beta hydrolase n=1 Tax=unclassified Brevundimonas TaxID=2622653 RepID=UPI000CFC0666|nr:MULTISPECIES: alpha/beta hydrolase [unclassified Brevundimonas]PRA27399.1 esterase [Brevundimonas sp. MYb27]PQZ84552.1 esterase [Brevundimonas sp. MYb31]PRB17788.1 esterase [Brevundimonas sp. MYb52]PRB38158.1 esterase [Brevundimonas sp. MYb46]PRB56059.1 esterase [Brevundimonas sp. MYb33]
MKPFTAGPFGWMLGLILLAAVGCAKKPPELPGVADDPAWEVVRIWSGAPIGDMPVPLPEARVLQDVGWRKITLLRDVSTPSVTIIRPREGTATGAAMVILPGGGFGGLAWDVEGTEVGEYLAERGVTAFVVRYRVRTPPSSAWLSLATKGINGALEPGRIAASQDAMQAVRLIRQNADRYGVDPDRVGMMGFSAGAITLLRVLQDADEASRPNVAASVYGLLFDDAVRPEQTPMFVAVAQDDLVKDARKIEAIWTAAGAPLEMHVYESGGHGFGLGRPGTGSMAFRADFETWLRGEGYLAPRAAAGTATP